MPTLAPRWLARRARDSSSMRMAELGAGPLVRSSSGSFLLQMVQANVSGTVNRATAMQVPAFVGALETYSRTISAFSLRQFRYGDPVTPAAFLNMPSDYLPYPSVIARLVTDLLLHDRAYWLVTERTWDGYPARIEVMRVEDVSDSSVSTRYTGMDQSAQPPMDPFYWNAAQVPVRDVIKFYGDGTGGWFSTGGTVINTAAALEAATLNYSEFPMPTVVLKNTGADLPPSQVQELLDAWEEARTNRASAYLNSTIEAKGMGWSARDLALVEARQESAVQVARMANLDPVWIGAAVQGSSLTYSNRVDLYRQLLDMSLRPVMDLITARLSMPDITPRGHTVRFDTSTFLAGNASDLAELVSKLVPLGVLTADEARTVIDLNTLGLTPTARTDRITI